MGRMRLPALLLVSFLGLSSTTVLEGPRRAIVNVEGGENVRGKILLEQTTPNSPVKIRGQIFGLPTGLHGLNIHESADISDPCARVQSQINPVRSRSRGLMGSERYSSDLGFFKSIAANPNRADISMIAPSISLYETHPRSVINRAVVIYGKAADQIAHDLERGESLSSEKLPSGLSLGCGVIVLNKESAGIWGEPKSKAWAFDTESEMGQEIPGLKSKASAFDISPGLESDWGSEPKEVPRHWSLGSIGRKSSAAWKSESAFGMETGGKVASNLDIEGVETPDYEETPIPFKPTPLSTSRVWKVGNAYEYEYKGWISTGMLAISPQLSGASISGRFVVEPKDESTVLIALKNTRSKIFNEAITEKLEDVDAGEEVRVVNKEFVEKPYLLKIINGKVDSVAIGSDEPLWVVNFKRGLAAQVQLQLDETAGIFSDTESSEFYTNNAVYTVMEGCTTGECQTYYHFSRVPEEEVETNKDLVPMPELCAGNNVYEIVKNRDFNKCKVLPVFNYMNIRGLDCNLAEFGNCENAMTRLDLARVIGCVANDGSFVVQKIKVIDKLIQKPFAYETEPLEGASIQRFLLRNIRKSGGAALEAELSGNVDVYKTLVYAYDEDLKTHGPYMNKPTLKEVEVPIVQAPSRETLIKEISRLFSEIVNDLESNEYYKDPVGKYVPDKLHMMRTAMAFLNYDDLRTLAANFMSGDPKSTPNQIFLESLVLCGSNPAVVLLQQLIASGKITKQQAIQSVAMLPATIKTPTKDLLMSLMHFLRSQIVATSRQLKITTALSLSLLVDKACVNTTDSFKMFPEMTMGQFCTPNDEIVVNELIPWLTEELNNAADDSEKLAMLAALGNIGHEAVIPSVLPYISSCEPTTEEEHSWYERARRSIKSESAQSKALLRQKWLKYKRAKGKLAYPLKEEEEEEHWGAGKWAKKDAKAFKKRGKAEKLQSRIMATELNEQRLQDKAILGERTWTQSQREGWQSKKPFSSFAEQEESRKRGWESKKAFSGIAGLGEEEEEEEEEDELGGIEIGEFIRSLGFKRRGLEDLELSAFNLEEEEAEEEETDDESCNLIRTKAVFAMAKLASVKDEAVIPILMPVFFNKEEDTQVRLAALSLLMLEELPIGFWTRIAVSTWFEPNNQVSAFIYSTLASLARNKDPKRREVTTKAEAVIPMVKPIRWAPHASYANVKGNYEERTRLGYFHKMVNLGGYESFMPALHYHNFRARAGPFRTKVLETAFYGKQLEKFIDQLVGEPTRRWQSAAGVYGGSGKTGKGVNLANASPELIKIHEELKIEARATGDPELYIYVNFLDNYQRFIHVDIDNFEKVVSNVVRNAALQGSGSLTTNYHRYTPLIDKHIRVPSAMGLAYSIKVNAKLFNNIKTSTAGNMNLAGTTSVQGAVQLVSSLKFRAKVTAEAAFVRAVPTTGVDVSVKTALPGKFRLAGDYKRGKVEASWAFLGDRVRIGHYGITPYTTVRSVDDFTPAMLLKETKLITLLDNVKESRAPWGDRALGLKFLTVERHDAKARDTPYAFTKDIMGLVNMFWVPATLRMRETEILLDVANSDTKVVKLQLAIAAKHHSEVEKISKQVPHPFSKGLFEGPYGRKIKSGSFMQEEDISEWNLHKFSKVSESMENPHGFTVDISAEFLGQEGLSAVRSGSVRGAGIKRPFGSAISDPMESKFGAIGFEEFDIPYGKAHRYGGSLSSAADPYGQRHRTHLMLAKELEHDKEENFVLCLEGDLNWPGALSVKRENFINDDVTTTGSVNIGFGKSCADRKVSIKTQFSRSDAPEYPKSASVKLGEQKCMKDELEGKGVSEECLSTRKLAAVLNKGIITINYSEMPPEIKNLTHKAENVLRHWFGAYLSDNQVNVNNKENEIRIETVYHPVIGTMDVRTYKPESNTFFHNIEVDPIAEAVVPVHARLTAYRAAFGGPGLCFVGEDSVTTFDGLNYQASLSNCDHVIAKDCSGRYKLAVLAREEQQSNTKVVTVLLNKEKIEIIPVANVVRVNNVERPIHGRKIEVTDDLNQIVAVVRLTPDNFVELTSPTHWIRVTVNPKEIIVLGSAVHRGRMCGLCGTQSGDKTDDLTGPRKCSMPASLMDVAYQLNRPVGCKAQSGVAQEIKEVRQIQESCKRESVNPLTRNVAYKSKLGSMWKREISPMRYGGIGAIGAIGHQAFAGKSREDISFAAERYPFSSQSAIGSSALRSRKTGLGGSSSLPSGLEETSWIPDEYSLPMESRRRAYGAGEEASCNEVRNKQIFRNGMRCFSVNPVVKCSEGCRPAATTEKKMGFHCIAKGRLTTHLNREMQVRPLDELADKEIHVVQSLKVPTACIPTH